MVARRPRYSVGFESGAVCLGPRCVYLHELRPECSNRAGAEATRGARENCFAERFRRSAENGVIANFLDAQLELDSGRGQACCVRLADLQLRYRPYRRPLGGADHSGGAGAAKADAGTRDRLRGRDSAGRDSPDPHRRSRASREALRLGPDRPVNDGAARNWIRGVVSDVDRGSEPFGREHRIRSRGDVEAKIGTRGDGSRVVRVRSGARCRCADER